MGQALVGCDIVVIISSSTDSIGLETNEEFRANAAKIQDIAHHCANICPYAVFLIGYEPVEYNLPLFAEVLKMHQVYNKHKVIGVNHFNAMYASSLLSHQQCTKSNFLYKVPIIGGCNSETTLPLLSHVPNTILTLDDITALTYDIQVIIIS